MNHKQLPKNKDREAMTGSSLLQYLPDIYRQPDKDNKNFLESFLEPFARILDQLDEKIFTIPQNFDPLKAPVDFIPWLAKWLSLDLYEILDKDDPNLTNNRQFILEAVELYKKKGTVPGIARLLSFLTGGKPCCVKEYANNVFRSYGMEHNGENEIGTPGGEKCTKFHRTTSTTINTANRGLMSDMGTYEDEVHYVTDTRENGLYNRDVVGLYIFIYSPKETFTIDKKIHEIIKTFLPVFVRAEIFVVEKVDYYEVYRLNAIGEEYEAHVHDDRKEKIKKHTGVYRDKVNWDWFYTNDKEKGLTFSITDPNRMQFRTPHSGIGVEILF